MASATLLECSRTRSNSFLSSSSTTIGVVDVTVAARGDVVNERHFPEKIAGTERFQQAVFLVIDQFCDLYFAFQNHVEGMLDGVFAAQNRSLRIGLNPAIRD